MPAASPTTRDDESVPEARGGPIPLFRAMPSWLVSFLIHLVLIILLAIFTFNIPGRITVSLESGDAPDDFAALEELTFDSPESTELTQNSDELVTNEPELTEIFEDTEIETDFEETVTDFFTDTEPTNTADLESNADDGMLAGLASQLSGRSASQRAQQLQARGGTPASENAVQLALKWLADHQLPDGSWSFDHRTGPGTHRTSPNPGDFAHAPNAATAMALLTFLGAGQTHLAGDYTETVDRGLAFLVLNAQRSRYGWTWSETQGLMYSHGLVAIALCEAYAMTSDVRLLEAARQSIRYIEYAQDHHGGGWRYEPKQRGDLSVAGWQIMALKSAKMCGLEVDSDVIRLSRRFLNFVSSESGAFYGYTDATDPDETPRKTMTSVGLLCQMYLGWSRENPALGTGVKWLSERGPEIGDWKPGMLLTETGKDDFRSGMYYNYYATQVMSQYGGEEWKEWNESMRDFLVATQATEGAARGSWFFQHPEEGGYLHGGRLYATTLAAMTLEVYYRYLPLYDSNQTSEAEFELD
jgi:hypothetical protein